MGDKAEELQTRASPPRPSTKGQQSCIKEQCLTVIKWLVRLVRESLHKSGHKRTLTLNQRTTQRRSNHVKMEEARLRRTEHQGLMDTQAVTQIRKTSMVSRILQTSRNTDSC